MRIIALLLLVTSYCSYANTIYVDQQNTGSGTGTNGNPYATIIEAIEASSTNDTIYVSSGTYRETITVTKNNLSIIALDDNVYITGTDTVSNWIDLGNGTFKAYVPNKCTQVFADKIPQIEARYPNTPVGTNLFDFNTTSISLTDTIATLLSPNPINESWIDGTIWMMVGHRWISQTAKIENYESDKLYLNHLSASNNGEGIAYITNTLQALDTIGEWHWQNDSLYYFFGNNGDINAITIEAQTRSTVIDLSSQSNISITGLKTYSGMINMNGTDQSSIQECEIKYLNNYHYIEKENVSWYSSWGRTQWTNILSHGIGVGIFGDNNTINDCEIAYSSGDCITLYGANNTVSNCIIHDANYLGSDMAPIALGGIGNTVTHNEIYNGGRGVITFLSAEEFLINYNKIHTAGLLNWDIGCLYTYDTDSKGGEISYNWIYDANSSNPESTWGGHGIYFDNNSINYTAHHNVVWDCKGDGIRLNMPANNLTVFNNTTFECKDMTTYLNPIFTGESSSNCTFVNNYIEGPILSASWLATSNNLSSSIDFLADRANSNFMPISTSPLIDSAVVISNAYEYFGLAPDIGAYENGGIDWKVGPHSTEDVVSGINTELHKTLKVTCFPNPTTDNITISVNDFDRYSILNSVGQIIKQGSILNRRISLVGIPHGTYIVNVFSQSIQKGFTVVKK